MAEKNELMKRPTKSDDVVKRRAMEMFMPKVKAYLGNEWTENEAQYIKEQIEDVLDEFRDGYKMARELERKGWGEDRALVDLMDDGEMFLSEAYKEIVEQWVKCYGITPERKIGDTVSTNHWARKGQVGVITRIYDNEAKYAVRFPDQPQTSAMILEYEDVVEALVAA